MSLKIAVTMGAMSPRAGGMYHSVSACVRQLHGKGYDVEAFGVAEPLFRSNDENWAGLKARALSCLGPKSFGYLPHLSREITQFAPRIIHQHGLWMYRSVVTTQLKKTLRCHTVISPRGMLDSWALSNSHVKKKAAYFLFEKENLANASCLHALNEAEASSIRKLVPNVPVAIIPNGVREPEKKRHRQPAFLNGDSRRTVLFLGRLNHKKGINELLRAWKIFKEEKESSSTNWNLVVAGWPDGMEIATLRRCVNEFGCADSVYFPGPVYEDNKIALLQHSEVFVLPSFSEGLPMGVLEALSYGLSVLMTRECNLPGAFSENAAVEISTNPRSIADGLRAVIEEEKVRSELGDNAKRYCGSYSWNAVGDSLSELYNWLNLGGKPPKFVWMPK